MAPLTEEHNASIADFVPGLDRLAANGNLLLSPAGAGRLVAAGVDRGCGARERASDHAPVWIEIADAAVASPRRATAEGGDFEMTPG